MKKGLLPELSATILLLSYQKCQLSAGKLAAITA